MLHSGSRNIGNKTGIHYEKLAKQLNEEWSWDSKIPPSWKLNFLPLTGKNKKYGEAYMREMNWCLDFAQANRQIMMDTIKNILVKHTGCDFLEEINIHHNYCSYENHYGENVIVHRKGATSAKLGQLGIIPGSMGTKSYIVRGKGNPESFNSCSHGAGRTMSRSEAKKTLDFDTERQKLEALGILHGMTEQAKVDEADDAYKNVEEILNNQDDLVEIVTELSPDNLFVIKG
jgi:tRNA-splicing ligase RtcB